MATLTRYLARGLKAGAVGGLLFGLFVALVGNPLVAYAETFEHGHGAGPVVPSVVTAAASVAGGVVFGLLLGAAVFGVAFYFLEPALPGADATKSYLLAGAGFLTVSGAPWVLFPPQPPGVEQALPTDVRLAWYAVMMVTGAVACGLAGAVYGRLRTHLGKRAGVAGALAAFALVPVVAAFAPANPVSGSVPADLVVLFRAVTAVGQVGLWVALATTHAWLGRDTDALAATDLDSGVTPN